MDTLLIIADEKDQCCATPRGLELAAKLNLAVEIVAFSYSSMKGLGLTPDREKALRQDVLRRREAAVQARIDKYRDPQQNVQLKSIWKKDIVGWVTKRCRAAHIRMVVKTGRRSETLLHTSSDWQLLRECSVPVLVVAEKRWHRTKPVLAALDLTSTVRGKRALDRKVLAAARNLAVALNTRLEVVAAIEVPALLSDLDLVDPHAYFNQACEAIQPVMDKLAAEFDLPIKAFHRKRGPAEKVLVSEAARVRAQIVVMGTVARKGVTAKLLGNTAEQVLQHMKTDVLAVKP
ncbi:MAG: universal stress protein [Pseudomonadota bacterium]